LVGKDAQPRHAGEPDDGVGRGAKAVPDLFQEGVDLLEGGRFAQAVVELHAQGGVADVLFGKARVERDFELGLRKGGRALFTESFDGAL